MNPISKAVSATAFCLVAAHTLSAAIVVNGLTDRARYDASVTFTVAPQNGYDTTALLDGQPLTVGTPETVNSVRYHELVVSQQPSGGGAVETRTIQFIVRNPERISTEDGLPTFTLPPVVDDAPSLFTGGSLLAVAPRRIPAGMEAPLVFLLRQPNGAPLWLNGTIRSTNFPGGNARLLRGFASALLPAFHAAGTNQWEAHVAGLSVGGSLSVPVEPASWSQKGGVLGGLEDWGADALIYVTNSVTVPAGSVLRIGAGSLIALGPGVELIVSGGAMELDGRLAEPIVFAPRTPGQPWGGVRLTAASGSRLSGSGAIFTGAGADPGWFNTHGGYSVHRREEACLLVDSGAEAVLTNCFFIRLAGQAFHLKSGRLSLTDCLVNRATTAGELTGGTFQALRCGFLEFPDDTTNFVDEDNDALYLVPGSGNTYTVDQCAIGFTKDDGIDTGAGHIVIRSSWIENCIHEGFSPSNTGHDSESHDTVFFHCGQGVEQGFGRDNTLADHCAMIGCMVGIRSGDNYGAPTFTDYGGVITASNCLSLFNQFHDVWGYEWNSWTYRTDRMNIQNNHFTSATPLHPNNKVWDPATDGPLLAGFMPVSNSVVGVAVTGAKSGSFFSYPGIFEVRLSSFSARQVSVDYALIGKSDAASSDETMLAGGTLDFMPGETRQRLDLALPGISSFGFLRLALNNAQNAELTRPDLIYFATDPAPPDAVLVSKGATNWSYTASGAEPAGTWEAPSYDDAGWVQGKEAPIGFGNIGASGAYVPLQTVLTSSEQGPSNNRTRAVYFRHHFNVPEPSLVRQLELNLMRDDGVVVYLNGEEVGRNNLDSGTTVGGVINYSRLATRALDGAEEGAFVSMPVSDDLVRVLQPGDNVLAVEVHQASATSSDLVLDAELIAHYGPPVENVVGIGRSTAGRPFLFWLDERWELQRSTNLIDWLLAPDATSPWNPPSGKAAEFFRWVR